MSTREPELSRDYLIEHYINKNETRYVISKETGVSPTRIGTLLQKYGIHRYAVQRHGLVKHPLNNVWCGMKERCTNPNAENYKWYGGSGVTICDEWKSFMPFYDWAISHGWRDGLTLDRIDYTLGYSPDNCRFVTMQKQCRNRRSNVYITAGGRTMLQCEWEEFFGLPKKRLSKWKYRRGLDYVVKWIESELSDIC